MKLWLLRHAPVRLPAAVCYGASDVPADEAATAAAARDAAARLPAGLPVWTSALSRAQQLGRALQALRPDLGPPCCDPRLNEMDFGEWELQPWSAVPREALDAWVADFAHHRVGGAESTEAVIERVDGALQECLQRLGPGGQGVWITHAGVIRAVQYLAAGGPRPIPGAMHWPREAPAPGGYVTIDVDPTRGR